MVTELDEFSMLQYWPRVPGSSGRLHECRDYVRVLCGLERSGTGDKRDKWEENWAVGKSSVSRGSNIPVLLQGRADNGKRGTEGLGLVGKYRGGGGLTSERTAPVRLKKKVWGRRHRSSRTKA